MATKVSVILSFYNQREVVRQAVDSVLGQTYPNIELIATDNGSTDGTGGILRSYERDPRVRVILRTLNGNLNTLANEATALSTGEFISLLHGIIIIWPKRSERQMASFAGLGPDFGAVYGPSYRMNDLTGEQWLDRTVMDSGLILEQMLLKFHSDGGINIIAPLIRRECFLRYPFREEFFMEGESIFFRMAMSFKFRYLGEPLTVMRDHMTNMGKAMRKNRDWVVPLFERLGAEPDFPPNRRHALRRFLGRHLRNYGWQGPRFIDDPVWARECFLMAFRRDPAQLLHPRTLVGLGILALPTSVIAAFNRVMSGLVKYRVNAVYKNNYV